MIVKEGGHHPTSDKVCAARLGRLRICRHPTHYRGGWTGVGPGAVGGGGMLGTARLAAASISSPSGLFEGNRGATSPLAYTTAWFRAS